MRGGGEEEETVGRGVGSSRERKARGAWSGVVAGGGEGGKPEGREGWEGRGRRRGGRWEESEIVFVSEAI